MAQETPAAAAMEALQGADVNKLIEFLQTDGLSFAIDLALAFVIFFLGRFVIRLVVRAISKAMQKMLSIRRLKHLFVTS